jgi:Leucine-rich repeat (LRR) protein
MTINAPLPCSDLSTNRLTSVSSSALFSNLVNIRILNLGTNSIASLDPLPSLPLLTSLSVLNNRLTTILAGQFTGAAALRLMYEFSRV